MVCSPLLWSLTETVPVNSLLDLDVVLPLNFLPEMAVGKVLLQFGIAYDKFVPWTGAGEEC